MSNLNAQTDRGYTKRVSIAVGDRRGLLTAVRKLDVSCTGERWLYRCDCGGYRIAVTSAINQSVRDGSTPACRECASDLHDGRADAAERKRAWFLLELWEVAQTLYSANWEQRVAKEIAEDLERELGPARPLEKCPVVSPVWESKSSENQQRMAYLFPVGNDSLDEVWTCCHCGEPTWRCFECVLCEQAACIGCVREERHKHYDPGSGHTLSEIAASFGVTKQTIREIEARALRKLRHPSRKEYLQQGRAFLDLP